MQVNLNDESREIPEGWADESLLFLLREELNLPEATFRCRLGAKRRLNGYR